MSYAGNTVELPLGPAGLTGSKNLAGIPSSFFLEASNVSYETGAISKEGGSAKFNAVAIPGVPQIAGGWDWWPTNNTQRSIIVATDGNIYKDSGFANYSQVIKTGLTMASVVPVFVEGGQEVAANNRKLFIFTGKNPVQVLSADAGGTTNIATPPADWVGANQPITGVIHEGRLWGFLRHRAYFSDTTNHETMAGGTAGSISVYPGESEEITCAISFKGALIVWKRPTGVYLIDTSDTTVINWRVIRLTQAVGMSSPRGAVICDDDVLYQDKDGNFQFLSATSDFGDLTSRNLSSAAGFNEFIRDKINLSRLPFVRAAYYAAKREAHFAIAGVGFGVNNRRIVIDFNNNDLPRFRFSDKDTCQSLWLKKDVNLIPRLTSGDDAGFVWDLDQGVKSKAGAGYNSRFQTAHNDLSESDPSMATKQKLADFLELIFQPKGAWNFYIDVMWDGRVVQTLTFDMSGPGARFGTARFGTARFGGATIRNIRKRLIGGGRRISLIGRNGNPEEDFLISKAILHFRAGDERIR